MSTVNWDWLDLEWLSQEKLFEYFEYERETFLYVGLWAPIAILILLFLKGIIQHYAFQSSKIATKRQNIPWSGLMVLKIIPNLLFGLFIAFLCIALAGPQKSEEQSEQWSEGIDIMLALDVSQSMDYKDFKPNRLEQVKQVALEFIEQRKHDRIGLVQFSGEAYSRTPLTTDQNVLMEEVKAISLKDIEAQGTAIGNALGLAAFRIKDAYTKSKTKIIILISDGESNAGNLDPETAAKEAAKHGIKIYTIGVGKTGKVLAGYQTINSFFGKKKVPQYVNNTLDEKMLRKLAEIGSGEYFHAKTADALKAIFKQIDEYEKTELLEDHYKTYKNYYDIYLKWAIIPFLLWLLMKSSFIMNATID